MKQHNELFTNIPATCDFMFKYIFGSEQSTGILKSFINAFQQDSGLPEVTELTLLNPCTPKTWLKEKDSTVDVLCRDMTGARFTIEMQALDHEAFLDRTMYYWAKTYASQIVRGDDYTELRPVIGINIVNFNLFRYNEKYHTCFRWTDSQSPGHLLKEDCVIHYLELPKIPERPKTGLELWNNYLKCVDKGDEKKVKTLEERCEAIAEANRRYEEANQDIEARTLYEGRIKYRMIQTTIMNSAVRKAQAEALEKGMAKGIAKGMAKGRDEEQAKAYDALLKMVSEMKKTGLGTDQIIKITGLDRTIIEEV